MCLNVQVVCPGCGLLVEQSYEECLYPGGYWGHVIFPTIQTLQFPQLLWWSCPTKDCDLNQALQWSLASLHETAIRKGQAYSQSHTYTPLAVDDEGDEACELALSPEEVGIPSAPQPSALSAEDRLTARRMVERGETIKAVAEALGKGQASMGRYIAAYYRPNPHNSHLPKASGPFPRLEEDGDGGSESEEDGEEVDTDEDEEFLPDISIKTTKPIPGAPHPRWLCARERRLVQTMRARGESKRAIVEALGRPRVQLVKYINAYLVPHEAAVVPDPALAPAPAPCPAPAPAPAPNKRKRSTEEPRAEHTQLSKRLRPEC